MDTTGSYLLRIAAAAAVFALLAFASPALAADPAAPSRPDLLTADDTGAFRADDVTSTTRPHFRVVAGPGLLVELVEGDVVVGSVLADARTGVATVQVDAPLADGVHQLAARARVNATTPPGPASAALAVTIDTVAPRVPVLDLADTDDSGSSNQDNETNLADWHIYGELGDAFSVPTREVSPTLRETVYPATSDWTFLPDAGGGLGADGRQGTWTYYARGKDLAGNESAESAPLAIVFDSVAPATPAQPDLVADDDSGAANDDNVTNVGHPRFDVAVESGALPELFADGAKLDGKLADGEHVVTARAGDRAGNVSGLSSALTIAVDTTKPTGTVVVAEGARSVRDPVVGVRLDFVDVRGPTERRISADGGATWTDWAPYVTGAAATLPGADGTKTVSVEVRDLAGNVGSATDEIILDRAGPEITLAGVLNGATLDVSQLVGFLYTATDVSDVAASSATVDGRALENDSSIDAGRLLTGTHRIVVSATDSLDNSSQQTFVFTVHATIEGVAHELDEAVAAGQIDPNLREPLLANLDSRQLRAFSNQVRAQSGKKIDAALAKLLVDWADDIGAGP